MRNGVLRMMIMYGEWGMVYGESGMVYREWGMVCGEALPYTL
jgi:hypothetical protein